MTAHTEGSPHLVLRTLSHVLGTGALPDPPPPDPMPVLAAWFEEARLCGMYDNFDAMTLATATNDGAPSARIVLCKKIELDPPALVFFTNYASRKGAELEVNPRAAAVFHWPHAGRQVRVEGDVARTDGAESDEYFRSRSLVSRIGACASDQSRPLATREHLIGRALTIARRAIVSGGNIARPAEWGGYRLLISSLELWASAAGRLHDRVVWSRERSGTGCAWQSQRLNP